MGEPNPQPQWLTAEQANDMVAQAVAAALAQHSADQPVGSVSADQIQQIVDQALAKQAEAHSKQLEGLMASMRGNVATFIPHNAGGVGTEIAETWSAYEQSLAHAADAEATRQALAAA